MTISCAEEKPGDLYQQFERINRETQLRSENAQLQREKSQLEFEKYHLEAKKMDAEIASLLAARKQEEAAINANLKDAAKRIEAADETRSQIEQFEIRQKDQLVLGVMILTITGFLWNVVRKYKKEACMKYNEKFGIVIVLISGLLILMSLMISVNWGYRLDFMQNLMMALQIQLFPDQEGCYSSCSFAINLPTKYVVLSLLALAAYGFTTYLGITPAPKKKVKQNSETAPDMTT